MSRQLRLLVTRYHYERRECQRRRRRLALCVILRAICAHGIEIVRDTTTVCRGGSNVISPFKALLGISVKVEIFDLLPGGWVGEFVLS